MCHAQEAGVRQRAQARIWTPELPVGCLCCLKNDQSLRGAGHVVEVASLGDSRGFRLDLRFRIIVDDIPTGTVMQTSNRAIVVGILFYHGIVHETRHD